MRCECDGDAIAEIGELDSEGMVGSGEMMKCGGWRVRRVANRARVEGEGHLGKWMSIKSRFRNSTVKSAKYS